MPLTGFKHYEKVYFHTGAFGVTLPEIHRPATDNGQPDVFDLRIFRGDTEKDAASSWKASTEHSKVITHGFVSVASPISQVMKRHHRYKAKYYAGIQSENKYFEYGDRSVKPKGKSYSYVTALHPFVGPIGKRGSEDLFVPKYLNMHHLSSDPYREADFLVDCVIETVNAQPNQRAQITLRVDTPAAVQSLMMPGSGASAPVEKKLGKIPQNCTVKHGHAELRVWDGVDLSVGSNVEVQLQNLVQRYSAVTGPEALAIMDALAITREVLSNLSPAYKTFRSAIDQPKSDPWDAIGLKPPMKVRRQRVHSNDDEESDENQRKKKKRRSRWVPTVSDSQVRCILGLLAEAGVFDKLSKEKIEEILKKTATFKTAASNTHSYKVKETHMSTKPTAVLALYAALGIDTGAATDAFEEAKKNESATE